MVAVKGIRNIAAWCISIFFILFGFTKKAKRRALNGDYILSIYFHTPNKKLFEFCVKWLIRNKFTILSQSELLQIQQESLPFPKGGVVITLDDGWQSNIDNVVPIAEKYKVPVTIFIAVDSVVSGDFWWSYAEKASAIKLTQYSVAYLKTIPNDEREKIVYELKCKVKLNRLAMTVDQLKHIAKSKYVTIGSHTMSHPILVNCSDEKTFFELKESKEILEEWLSREVIYFAYPNGDYSSREINYLKAFKYKLAYTTAPVYLTKSSLKKEFEIPRFEVFENVSYAEAICRMLGVWQKTIKK